MRRDEAHRHAARNETERALLVEASAGTGKTQTLVDRIVTLVVSDEDDGGVPITQIAALTFTEKAAGEMKGRVRGELEKVVRGEGKRDDGTPRDAAEMWRAQRALDAIDLAQIATIHSFCASVLRERPVDARVDPDFTTPQPATVRELLDEAFAEWFDAEARRSEGGPLVEALAEGLLPDALLELAHELYGKRATFDGSTVPEDALAQARERIGALLAEARALSAELPPELAANARGMQVRDTVADLQPLRSLSLDELAEVSLSSRFNFGTGARKGVDPEWRTRAEALRDGVEELADLLPTLPKRILFAQLVNRVHASLFPLVEAKKRERGFLDFDDLLLVTRDVLRRSPAVREHFQERFRALLVDEFQDTDPVQAEIVLRLASAADDDRPWNELEIAGGLFVVGDPKQSIYRFRSADVETYGAVKALFPEDAHLTLSSSFRSDPRLVAWVNAVFERVLVERARRPWEVGYAALEPEKPPEGDDAPVLYLLPPADLGDEQKRADERRAMEATAVANLLLARFAGKVAWSDVAVLVSSNAGIDTIEAALRAAGIPAVAEGGKSYTQREETAAVVAALRAIADPGDGVALAAALKSFLFAATDVDLVEAAENGFRFDGAREAPAGTAIAPHIALLQRLRARRHERPTAETLMQLLAERSAFASLAAGATGNAQQAVANVERLVASARALDAEGLSFRETVAALHGSLDADAPEPRAVEERENAVRILTLHKSKGLEFGVVVLAGLGLADREKSAARATVCFDRPGGFVGARISLDGLSVKTPRFESVLEAESERLLAEDRRLMYVGATRAKKRLVVSWWTGWKKEGDKLEQSFLGPLACARDLSLFDAGVVEEVLSDVTPPMPRAADAERDVAGDPAAAMRSAAERLDKARATASRPLRRAGEHAFVPARAEDLPASDRGDEEVSDRALRVGIAVHRAMELLLDPARSGLELDAALGEACVELPGPASAEVRRLVQRLLGDAVTARARAARRRFVEVPLLFAEGETLVEGKIDLLFEEEDGFVLVDWKTDRVDTPAVRAEREAIYASQLAAYEEGLRRALGPTARLKESRLVFARA